jgi:hypothetical protein
VEQELRVREEMVGRVDLAVGMEAAAAEAVREVLVQIQYQVV